VIGSVLIGTEHEYSLNTPGMAPVPESDRVLAELAGEGASEAPLGKVTLTKELQKTVVEMVPARPAETVAELEGMLVSGIAEFSRLFSGRYLLLGLGMHPTLRLQETAVWDQGEGEYYEAYDRIFDLSRHGWQNIQSVQLNISYPDEPGMVRLFNALRSLIPYLVAVSAASPFVEGHLSGAMDTRLLHYRENQAAIPLICNRIVPERLDSFRTYRDWLSGMYRELRARGGSVLCEEWVASFGVIVRFSRPCVELKVMDEQECLRSDMALVAFLKALLKSDLSWLEQDRGALLELTEQAIFRGTPVLRPELLRLFRSAERAATPSERRYLPLVRERIEEGSLAELLARDWREERDLPSLMGRLAGCLAANTPYR
jgi:gamma-glutamyl:cysteine ligase YbdK (ATP-grasp superfamily)